MATRPKQVERQLASLRLELQSFLAVVEGQGLLDGYSPTLVARWLQRSGGDGFVLNIPPGTPLRFAPVVHAGLPYQPDLYCRHEFHAAARPFRQDALTTVIRLWERPPQGGARVVCRYHVDLANAGQRGPYSHLQLGGRSIPPDENCDWAEIVGEMRWALPLFDVVLATEFVVYSFWPEKWEDLSKKPEFVNSVCQSQTELFDPFLELWRTYQSQQRTSGIPKHSFLGTVHNLNNANPWLS